MIFFQMPANSQPGKYQLRVEGRLREEDSGNIWQNTTEIEYSSKQASLFIQMSRPLYKQGQQGIYLYSQIFLIYHVCPLTLCTRNYFPSCARINFTVHRAF